ncbi:DUF3054 domain-containing protein [Isoptericola rhizosphaerae]|uniref:DUF3054 domain-containing protein n=1 Tax=Isoptericola rhizosphaerae TaxID=3377837 RepID=UPI00383AEC75
MPVQERRVWPTAVADAVCVLVFAVVGTANHASGGSVAHLLAVVAPFAVGLVVGWVASRAWRAPARLWPTGVVVWFATVALGLVLRPLVVGGFAWSFALVTAGFLGATMLGWRLLVTLVQRR